MSSLSAPLWELLKKNMPWVWTQETQESFQGLRARLTKAPVLAYFVKAIPLTLSVDASQKGVGAVLLQNGHPIAYSLRSLTEVQKKYTQIEEEMLAIVHGCTRFEEYVLRQPEVIVKSDHHPLDSIFRKPHCECLL